MYATVIETPPRWQWERLGNSERNRPFNCAVAASVNILDYYNDNPPPGYPQDLARYRAGIPAGTATSPSQQQRILANGGLTSYISQPSLAAVKALVAYGNRPILAGLYFARVPNEIADHPFDGFHAITVMGNTTMTWLGAERSALWYRDANFSPWTNRLDPDDGRKKMPDTVFEWAFISDPSGGSRGWAVIPDHRKLVLPDTPEDILPTRLLVPNPPLLVTIKPARSIRARQPRFAAPAILPGSDASVGPYPLVGFTDQGEAYDIGGGKRSRKWGCYKINTDPDDKYAGYVAYFPAIYGDTQPA